MQNFTKYLEDQRPRFRPSEHKELVKISGDRTLEIQISKKQSRLRPELFNTSNRKNYAIRRTGNFAYLISLSM